MNVLDKYIEFQNYYYNKPKIAVIGNEDFISYSRFLGIKNHINLSDFKLMLTKTIYDFIGMKSFRTAILYSYFEDYYSSLSSQDFLRNLCLESEKIKYKFIKFNDNPTNKELCNFIAKKDIVIILTFYKKLRFSANLINMLKTKKVIVIRPYDIFNRIKKERTG